MSNFKIPLKIKDKKTSRIIATNEQPILFDGDPDTTSIGTGYTIPFTAGTGTDFIKIDHNNKKITLNTEHLNLTNAPDEFKTIADVTDKLFTYDFEEIKGNYLVDLQLKIKIAGKDYIVKTAANGISLINPDKSEVLLSNINITEKVLGVNFAQNFPHIISDPANNFTMNDFPIDMYKVFAKYYTDEMTAGRTPKIFAHELQSFNETTGAPEHKLKFLKINNETYISQGKKIHKVDSYGYAFEGGKCHFRAVFENDKKKGFDIVLDNDKETKTMIKNIDTGFDFDIITLGILARGLNQKTDKTTLQAGMIGGRKLNRLGKLEKVIKIDNTEPVTHPTTNTNENIAATGSKDDKESGKATGRLVAYGLGFLFLSFTFITGNPVAFFVAMSYFTAPTIYEDSQIAVGGIFKKLRTSLNNKKTGTTKLPLLEKLEEVKNNVKIDKINTYMVKIIKINERFNEATLSPFLAPSDKTILEEASININDFKNCIVNILKGFNDFKNHGSEKRQRKTLIELLNDYIPTDPDKLSKNATDDEIATAANQLLTNVQNDIETEKNKIKAVVQSVKNSYTNSLIRGGRTPAEAETDFSSHISVADREL